jgi:hypothetical protein
MSDLPQALPPCTFRGDCISPAGMPPQFPCSHPLIRGAQPAAVVSVRFCSVDCVWPRWDAAALSAGYTQQVDLQPTEEEHAARVAICDACESRIANYCPRAGGTCSLRQKLTKGGFSCPLGKFGVIERCR